MKKIDDSYFVNEQGKQTSEIEDVLAEDEKVLWQGSPRKGSFIMSAVFKMLPIAIIWLAFDGAFIAMLSINAKNLPGMMIPILIGFFALHLTPVWAWLYNVITAVARQKRIRYAFTGTRIIIKTGFIGSSITSIYYSELTSINLHIGIVEKMFKVGDVCISTTNGNYVLEDIEDPNFVTTQLQKIGNDIKTDMMYPNAMRPKQNEGYKTEYSSSATRNLNNKRK